ncbi:Cu/Ag efflux pump CusA [Streptacidiphilus sp. MAP12-16]|uniref:efflux RND transporter permease subunit n=1 Tax=Streptacidiphilus sp. MAP12-16 TaxID=3156300 RepID=UPI003513F157
MRWIIGSSLRLAAALVAAAIVLLAVGFGSLRHAAVDTLPEFLPPQVQVQTEALGLSVNEVEQLVTVPLEDEFNGLAFLDHLRSQSVPGLSSIELTFKPGTDIYKARQLVTERVAQGPAVVNVGTPPVMIQPQSSESRTMMVGLSSRTTSLIDLSTLARWRIRPRLLAVPGVANVTIWGQRDQQLQVLVDPAKLHARGVTLSQVINTTGDAMWTSPLTFVEASSPGADGFIDTPNQRLSVQHILPITKPEDLAKVPLEDITGSKPPVKLGDVTTVVEDHPAMRGDAILSSGPGFLLVVEKLPGANTLAVARGVEAAMADLKPGLTGITVDTSVFRPATFVESALHNLGWAALAGLLLLTAWLGACWRSWRVALLGLVAVALPLVAAAYLLYLQGITFTGLTLAGLLAALGVIVDDAVMGVAALRARQLEPADADGNVQKQEAWTWERRRSGDRRRAWERRKVVERRKAVPESGEPSPLHGATPSGASRAVPFTELLTDAFVEARRPLGFALAVVLLAAVPLLLIPGLGGSLARPIVVAYLLALLAATIVALTVTPALAFLLLRGGHSGRPEPERYEHFRRRRLPVARWAERAYDRVAPGLLRPAFAGGLALLLTLVALTLVPQLSGSHGMIPVPQDRDLVVQWQAPPGTSLPAMEQTATAAGDSLRAISGVRDVASDVGQSLMGDQVVSVDSAQTWITLAPGADYGRATAAVRRALDQYPTVRHTLLTYPQLALETGRADTTDGDGAVRVRLYGTDPQALAAQADRIRQAIAGVPGVSDPTIQQTVTEPSIQIATDVDRAAAHGLKPGDVRRATAVLIAGIAVGSYYQQQQIFDVAVWSTPAVRQNLDDLQNLLLDTPSGDQVKLKDIATVSIQPAAAEIDHDQASRFLDVTAGVRGQDLSGTLSRVRSAVRTVELPLGYHAEISSGLQQTQGADLRLVLYVLGCTAGVFLLFQAAMRSWTRALMLLLTVPLALAGGALTAMVNGPHMTTGALAGFLALLGVAVRGGLTLVRRTQVLQLEGGLTQRESVLAAARVSVLPTLATAVGLALLLVPFTLRGDIAGMELARPLALVVLGGLVSTTLVTLFLLPALQLWLPGARRDSAEGAHAQGPGAGPGAAAGPAGEAGN